MYVVPIAELPMSIVIYIARAFLAAFPVGLATYIILMSYPYILHVRA